jgi:NAD(P)H-flavin reductase/hemoglobin-like flavoprotein
VVAIALDSGSPDGNSREIFAGQPLWAAFGRHPGPSGARAAATAETPCAAAETSPGTQAPSRPAKRLPPPEFREPEYRELEYLAAADPGNGNSAIGVSEFHARLVKESFAAIEMRSGEVMEHFYARLFAAHPEIRAMFPLGMSAQREQVFGALAGLVQVVDDPGALASRAGRLGRDHRKFGVRDKHYDGFFAALLDAVRVFSPAAWTADTQAAWDAAAGAVAGSMRAAAAADAERGPPWWIGEVVRHDQRGADLAVLTVQPDQPLHYLPGQYLAVQVARWPRVWRNFSIANAPRSSGSLDLHVRAIPGGLVSNTLVHYLRAGDTILLGPARGEMTMAKDSERDLLCVAGGTGLAPIKAIIEGVAGATQSRRPAITLYVGARTAAGLYDLRELALLEAWYPALKIIPVVSDDPDWAGRAGMLPDVVSQDASPEGSEVFISGPAAMVTEAARVLARRVPRQHVHHDPIGAATA